MASQKTFGDLMPTITYDKKDLVTLIGKNFSDQQLEEVISLIKPNIENLTKEEITLELTPDRPDLYGIEGLARSIRQYVGLQKGSTKIDVEKYGASIKVDNVPERPFVTSAIVRNVKMTNEFIKSLMNIQEVLHDTLGRKRKKVAIGIHDFDKIIFPVTYTSVARNSKIIPLDETKEMTLEEVLEKIPKGMEYGNVISNNKKFPVFMDTKGIFSFPPIINSDRTKVTKQTKNLFIEITAIDKNTANQVLNIIITNFAERKVKIESVKLNYGNKFEVAPDLSGTVVEVAKEHAEKLIGVGIKDKEFIELLERTGYAAALDKNKIKVLVPPYRSDILHPVDVIEDIAIAYGLNNLQPKLPEIATIGKSNPIENFSNKVRQLMIGFGFQEVIRPILSNFEDQFDKMNVPREEIIELENPVSKDYVCMRVWLLPSLLKVLSANKHVEYPQNIFEVGDVVWPDKDEETLSKTIRKVAGTMCGGKASFAEIKSVVDGIMKNLGKSYTLEPCQHTGYISGRAAHVLVDKKIVGSFGEVNPIALEKWQIEMPVASFELNLENL